MPGADPVSAGIGLAGGLISSLFGGNTEIENQQRINDAAARNQQALFNAENVNNAENAAFKQRGLAGLLSGAGSSKRTVGAGEPGGRGSFELNDFSVIDLFKSMGKNPSGQQFINDLSIATPESLSDRANPEFESPELKKPSFLNKLAKGLGGAAAQAGSSGFLNDLFGGGGPGPGAGSAGGF